MKTFPLKTKYFDSLIDSQLNYFDNGNTIKLDYSDKLGNDMSSTHKFPFIALVEIRLQLEELNMFIACNGARINVYPSGMSLIGLMAYELTMTKQAVSLVNIFEPFADIEKIVSVDEQKRFREKWLESLKH